MAEHQHFVQRPRKGRRPANDKKEEQPVTAKTQLFDESMLQQIHTMINFYRNINELSLVDANITKIVNNMSMNQ